MERRMNSNANSNVLLPLFSLIAGAGLGFLCTLLLDALRQRQALTLRLLDQYFDIRKDIVVTVSDITALDLNKPLSEERREILRNKISKLFYQHYDFLPRPVLESLMSLHTCVADYSGGIYTFRDGAIAPIKNQDLHSFVQECSLFRNAELLAALALKSKNPAVRANEAINLHARHVLYALNRFASIRDLLSMTAELKKMRHR
jgi:hypothetical protein